MTMSASVPTRRSAVSHRTALTTGAVAGVIAAATNLVIAAIARGPLDADDAFVPLTLSPIIMWTVLAAIIGAVGWRLIVTTSDRSDARLRLLVPTVLGLSLVPDVALLATDSTPGQTTTGVAALMLMHVVTAVILVTACRRAMPPSRPA